MEKEENLLFDRLKVLSILKFPIVRDSLCQFSISAFVSFIIENIEIGFFLLQLVVKLNLECLNQFLIKLLKHFLLIQV